MRFIHIKILKPDQPITKRLATPFEFVNWWNHTQIEEIHPLRPYERFVEYQLARGRPVMTKITFYKFMSTALQYCHAMHEKEAAQLEELS